MFKIVYKDADVCNTDANDMVVEGDTKLYDMQESSQSKLRDIVDDISYKRNTNAQIIGLKISEPLETDDIVHLKAKEKKLKKENDQLSFIQEKIKPSSYMVQVSKLTDHKVVNNNRIPSNAIKEHVRKIRVKKEAELNKKKLEREDKTKPLKHCKIPMESFKIMFIIIMEELYRFENTGNILHRYENMARTLGFYPIMLQHANVRSILQSLKENDKRNSRNVSCLALFIVTHEKSKELVELNGLQQICEETSKFDKIPKLFFIEACRGGILEENKNLNKTLSDEISNINIEETIIAYSTLLGPVEETSEVIMSSFADILRQAMLSLVDMEEFHKILTRVNNDVSRDRKEVKDKNGEVQSIKQMSSFRSSFPKRIFFTK